MGQSKVKSWLPTGWRPGSMPVLPMVELQVARSLLLEPVFLLLFLNHFGPCRSVGLLFIEVVPYRARNQ